MGSKRGINHSDYEEDAVVGMWDASVRVVGGAQVVNAGTKVK